MLRNHSVFEQKKHSLRPWNPSLAGYAAIIHLNLMKSKGNTTTALVHDVSLIPFVNTLRQEAILPISIAHKIASVNSRIIFFIEFIKQKRPILSAAFVLKTYLPEGIPERRVALSAAA